MTRRSDVRAVGRLLTRCLRVHPEDSLLYDLCDFSKTQWKALVAEATRHGVAPILFERLSSMEGVEPPSEALEELQNVYLHNRLKNEALLDQIREVISIANRCGAKVIALKGVHLASKIYSDPAFRPMVDIDLLADPADMVVIREAFISEGYTRKEGEADYTAMHHDHVLVKAGRLKIEVHRRLSRDESRFDVDYDGIWNRAAPAEVPGGEIMMMCQEDLFLHICTHAAFNDRFRIGLLSLCDVDAIVRRMEASFDWHLLVERANDDGRAPYVYSMLLLVQRALGTCLHDAVHRLNHKRGDEIMVAEALEYVLDPPLEVPTALENLQRSRTFGQQCRALIGVVFPAPDQMRKIYSLNPASKLVVIWYVLRPVDLVVRRGVDLMALVFRTSRGEQIRDRERRRRIFNEWVGRD